MSIRFTEIFVPGGFPKHTYNPRKERALEDRLSAVKDNLFKLAIITGNTKSGKTVLVRSVLPPEESIWIDGGTIGEEEDFWTAVIDQLELYQSVENAKAKTHKAELGAEGTAEGSLYVVSGKATLKGTLSDATENAEKQTRSISSRVAAISGLHSRKIPLVVDDFHYISKELQGTIVRAIKQPIFDGLPVVFIAIPHRRYDALKVEKEMTGRVHPIDVPLWSRDELTFIPSQGFSLLRSKLDASTTTQLATEAIGSPHLMQDFCRTLCRQFGITTEAEGKAVDLTRAQIEGVYREVAETIGRPIFEKLARGPRQRTDRNKRALKSGREVDIYGLVLEALAHLKPGLITLEYEDLRTAIKEVSVKDPPQLHEVARVLKHMAIIASSDQSSTPVIDFEEEDKQLHITDPFFAFFLRWGNLAG